MPKKTRKLPLKKRLEELVEEMVRRGIQLPEAHDQLDKLFLLEVMRAADGNQSRAAARLEVHRNTLRRKLKAHGLI
jgi:DNA-binding protein Fis